MRRSVRPSTSLAVLVAVNLLNFYDRHLIGALTEPIRKEFHLTDAQVGLIASAFIWLYALVGLPLGRVADVWSRRKLLATGMVVWSALTALGAFAGSYAILLVSRLGFGVGEAVVAPAAASWIGDLFPASQRSRALSRFMLGLPIGAALGYLFGGPMAQAYGWRSAMVFAAAPALVIVPLVLWLSEPPRAASSERASMLAMLRIPTMWWIIASGALLNFALYAITSFLPAFLSRVHGLSVGEAGVATGFIFGAGGVCGGLFAGRLGDWALGRAKNGRLLCAATVCATAAPFAWMSITSSSVVLAILLFAVAYAGLNAYYGLVYSAIQDIVGPTARGTAMAVYFLAMYFCGASFGPLITGKLSDVLAYRAAAGGPVTEAFKAIGLQQAMLVIPVCSVLLAVVLYCGSRTIIVDMEKQEAELEWQRA
jgi:predicted MFS family arabinose efflux permease